MALQKDTELDNGFNANYYKITGVHVNSHGKLVIHFDIYKDEASRLAGKKAAFSGRTVTIDFTNDIKDIMYDKAKADELFNGALNV